MIVFRHEKYRLISQYESFSAFHFYTIIAEFYILRLNADLEKSNQNLLNFHNEYE